MPGISTALPMGSTALVIGSTGLVGGHLLRTALADPRFQTVRSFARRPLGLEHPKLQAHVVNFREPETFAPLLTGDVLFSALGTTRKQAGSKQAQFEVDYTFQLQVAQAAARNGVGTYLLISSSGADADSRLFYPRIKGELERDVRLLGFSRVRILRPGILEGARERKRPAEHAAARLMHGLRFIPGLRALRPIHGRQVARAAIQAWSEGGQGVEIYGMARVFELAARADAAAVAGTIEA
jgi:uncharacterized protein YbjT (DUF2867 family)